MKTEQAQKLADQALQQLVDAVDRGGSEALNAYLRTMARFRDYSFGNCMLICLQCPNATHVAGFRTWRELGRYVKRGEKGIAIIAPMRMRREPADGEDERAEEASRDNANTVRFRVVYVFDFAQTDGDPLPELARVEGDPDDYTGRLKAFIAAKGIELEYTADIGSADGRSCGGKIQVRPNLSPAQEFHVLVHEVAHEMLHKSQRRMETTKTIRETEAEAVAFVVCQAIGFDMNSVASDYIRLYNGDREALVQSLGLIQTTAATLLKALESED